MLSEKLEPLNTPDSENSIINLTTCDVVKLMQISYLRIRIISMHSYIGIACRKQT